MTLPSRFNTALVYANFGRWVADCPCSGATEFGTPGNPPIMASAWQCVECGDVIEAIWPSPEMMYGVERLLLLRRYRKNQNWFPGETLGDLQVENGLHGVYGFLEGSELAATPGVSLMSVRDEEIVVDMVPVLNPRRELKQVGR
jgi:hypothetical protein